MVQSHPDQVCWAAGEASIASCRLQEPDHPGKVNKEKFYLPLWPLCGPLWASSFTGIDLLCRREGQYQGIGFGICQSCEDPPHLARDLPYPIPVSIPIHPHQQNHTSGHFSGQCWFLPSFSCSTLLPFLWSRKRRAFGKVDGGGQPFPVCYLRQLPQSALRMDRF